MKTFLQNTISTIRQGTRFVAGSTAEDVTGAVVSGYSLPSGDDLPLKRPAGFEPKPVGILYADIADYARLTEQDEEGTHRRLVEAVRIMMAHVGAHQGRIAHLAGDAILAEFRDADSALHCAINVQLAARQWNADLDADCQVLFRIGVNFGDVIEDHGDIYGNVVDIASRLEKLASSGGICVSESAMEKLDDQFTFKFVAMGRRYVKKISEPVNAFWIEIDSQRVVDPGLSSAVKVSAAVS